MSFYSWMRGPRPSRKAHTLWGIGLIAVICCTAGPAPVMAQGTRWEHYMAEGVQAYQKGQEANAEMFYLAALEDVENAGPEDPRLATTLNTLAVLYHAQRKYTQAESLYQRVLRLLEQTIGPEHPTLATTLNNLAVVYEAQGEYGRAELLYQRALTLLERTLGPEHLNLAAALENYADLLRKMQRVAEADTAEGRAKAIWAKHKREPEGKGAR
jgi:tetratricopeptide (TPR) repeat protein